MAFIAASRPFVLRLAGILLVALASGCAGTKEPARDSVQAFAAAPQPAAAARAAAKAILPAASVPPPEKHEVPAIATVKVEPPLDIAALKAKLRDTAAIGMMTKLALRNQVDDLLQQFRAHYLDGRGSLSALRPPFDALVMKVLSLLHDADPSLARAISRSREAIWEVLSNREKFNAAS